MQIDIERATIVSCLLSTLVSISSVSLSIFPSLPSSLSTHHPSLYLVLFFASDRRLNNFQFRCAHSLTVQCRPISRQFGLPGSNAAPDRGPRLKGKRERERESHREREWRETRKKRNGVEYAGGRGSGKETR